jgi:hypothetical protein
MLGAVQRDGRRSPKASHMDRGLEAPLWPRKIASLPWKIENVGGPGRTRTCNQAVMSR